MNSAGGNVKLWVEQKIVNVKSPNKIMIVQSTLNGTAAMQYIESSVFNTVGVGLYL